MSLTRTACRTRIRTLVAEPVARHFTEAEINSWIDDACRDISAKTFCCQLVGSAFETTNGTSNYAWPTTVNTTAVVTIGVKTVINSNSVSMQYFLPDMIGRTPGSGEEMCWTDWNNTFILSPTPTATYTLTPLIWIEQGCTAAGTIELKSIYHHIVPLYGHYKAMQKRKDFESANLIWQQYEAEMNRIANIHAARYNITLTAVAMDDQTPVD